MDFSFQSFPPTSICLNFNSNQSSQVRNQILIQEENQKNSILSQIKSCYFESPKVSSKNQKSTPPPPFKKYLDEKMHPENFFFPPQNHFIYSENVQEYSHFKLINDSE